MNRSNTLRFAARATQTFTFASLLVGLSGCFQPFQMGDFEFDELAESYDFLAETPESTSAAAPALPQSQPVYFSADAMLDTAVGSGDFGNSQPDESLYFDANTSMWFQNDTGGYDGDGHRATQGRLNWPTGVAVSKTGTMFVADLENGVVRCVNRQGILETCLGSRDHRPDGTSPFAAIPLSWPSGLAFGPMGLLFVIDADSGIVYRVDPLGHRRVVASGFLHPTGVAVDQVGNVYVAGFYTDEVFKISAEAALSPDPESRANARGRDIELLDLDVYGPGGLAVDERGNLFITDNGHHRILRRDASSGKVTVVAGTGAPGYTGDGGPATQANLHFPTGLATSPSGHVFFTDMLNNAVRVITPEGTLYTVVGDLSHAGGLGDYKGDHGPAMYGRLNNPYDVELDLEGNLLIADANNNRIRKVTLPAEIQEEVLEKL